MAATYGYIALVYEKQHEDKMALEKHGRCLAIRIKALGEDHLEMATA